MKEETKTKKNLISKMKKILIIMCFSILNLNAQVVDVNSKMSDVEYSEEANINATGGDFSRAIWNMSKAIELNPNKGSYYALRGELYTKLGNDEDAIKDFDKAIKIVPDHTYYIFRGNCKLRKETNESLREAIEDYTACIKMNDSYEIAYFNRASAYHTMRMFKKALTDYDKAIALNKTYMKAYFKRGAAYMEVGMRAKACEDFKMVSVIDPYARGGKTAEKEFCDIKNLTIQQLYLDSGHLSEFEENYELAIDFYTKAIQADPTNTKAYMKRAYAKEDLNDIDGACEDFYRAKELGYKGAQDLIDSDCSDVTPQRDLYESGNAKMAVSDYKGAIEEYTKSIAINNTAAMTFAGRGTAKAYLEDYKGAIEDYTAAINLDPSYFEAIRNRGVAKAKSHDMEGACKDIKRASDLGDQQATDMYNRNCKD